VLDELVSDLNPNVDSGLSEDEASRRLARNGLNRLTARRGTPAWRMFVAQLVQPLVVVLIVAAGVSASLGHVADALVISAVVLVNSVIGFLQEYRGRARRAGSDGGDRRARWQAAPRSRRAARRRREGRVADR